MVDQWDPLKYDGKLHYICERGHQVMSSEPLLECPVFYEGKASRTPRCGESMLWVLLDPAQAAELVARLSP